MTSIDRADRRAAFAQPVEIIAQRRRELCIRTEERIVVDLGPIPARAIDAMRAHLHERRTDFQIGDDLARHGARRNPHRGLARGLPSAAAIVAQAVFDIVGEVGVARAVFVLDVGIVLRALIDIVDEERNRRTGRHLRAALLVGENAGENSDRVGFLALRGVARLARPAAVEVGLNVGFAKRNARRTAVDHTADRRPMAFAEGRDAK